MIAHNSKDVVEDAVDGEREEGLSEILRRWLSARFLVGAAQVREYRTSKVCRSSGVSRFNTAESLDKHDMLTGGVPIEHDQTSVQHVGYAGT